MAEAIEPCTRVYIVPISHVRKIPYGDIVYRGYTNGHVEVLLTTPEKCVITPKTRIVFTRKKEITIKELKNNVAVIVRHGKKESVYVYPKKIFDKVMKDYVEPLIHDEPPENIGLLLIGAPGTGKTSLAKIIADYLGIPVYKVRSDIKGKLLGETEERLKKIIEEALSSEPSIVLFDDAEWLLGKREYTEAGGGTEESIRESLHNLLYEYLQEAHDEDKRVLFIATTNKKETVIDDAFRREGRFGEPIVVPLPDLEAVEYLLGYYGINDKRLAIKIINAGLPPSDIMERVIKRILKKKEPEIKPKQSRGYKRYYVEPIQEFSKIFDYLPKEIFSYRSRIFMHTNIELGTAIALQIISNAGKSVVLINDFNYIEEAIYTANLYGSTIIVPSELHRDIQYIIHTNSETPVIFIGYKPPSTPHAQFMSISTITKIVGVKPIVEAVANYIGIELNNDTRKKIEKIVSDNANKIEDILTIWLSLGYIDNKVLNILPIE